MFSSYFVKLKICIFITVNLNLVSILILRILYSRSLIGRLSLHTRQVAHQAPYTSFCCMKLLGVLLLPPGWDASLPQVTPALRPPVSIYTPGWRKARSKFLVSWGGQHTVPGLFWPEFFVVVRNIWGFRKINLFLKPWFDVQRQIVMHLKEKLYYSAVPTQFPGTPAKPFLHGHEYEEFSPVNSQ